MVEVVWMENVKKPSHIITIVNGDGEDVVAVLGDANPPRSDAGWTWSEYQRILRKWLTEKAVEIGDVHDEEENLTFIVYKTR
ncbi:MAG: hypothetical protein QXP83_07865 [Candidatus Nezhaarchaeales archaeon]